MKGANAPGIRYCCILSEHQIIRGLHEGPKLPAEVSADLSYSISGGKKTSGVTHSEVAGVSFTGETFRPPVVIVAEVVMENASVHIQSYRYSGVEQGDGLPVCRGISILKEQLSRPPCQSGPCQIQNLTLHMALRWAQTTSPTKTY